MGDIYIATHIDYKDQVREQLPKLPEKNILYEPASRNTAPCIGLAAMYITNKYKDAVMFVFPADHLIKFVPIFLDTLSGAYEIAMKDTNLVTIGITPDYPETGYGYVKFISDKPKGRAFAVDRFVEKPNLETAKQYLKSAEYL